MSRTVTVVMKVKAAVCFSVADPIPPQGVYPSKKAEPVDLVYLEIAPVSAAVEPV